MTRASTTTFNETSFSVSRRLDKYGRTVFLLMNSWNNQHVLMLLRIDGDNACTRKEVMLS